MKNLLFCLPFLLASNLIANDGAYYTSGNQLIPIIETDISVKKEVLRITRIDEQYVKIEVDYDLNNFGFYLDPADEESYKILRNYPFARRGYVFKTALIQQYYESMDWYKPNYHYKANLDALSDKEKKWLTKLKL